MGKRSQNKLDELINEIKKEKKDIKNKKTSKNIECTDCRYEADNIILRKYIKNNINKIDFTDRNYVYHISTLINSFYSTRMGADRLYAIAMKIANNGDFINKIMRKETKLCDTELKSIQNKLCKRIKLRPSERGKNDREFRSYSFVTKFLAIHSLYTSKRNISSFPIYDGAVQTVITNYGLNWLSELEYIIEKEKNEDAERALQELKSLKENRKTIPLDQYDKFYKFMNILSLITKLNLTELDHLFWKWGKTIKKRKAIINKGWNDNKINKEAQNRQKEFDKKMKKRNKDNIKKLEEKYQSNLEKILDECKNKLNTNGSEKLKEIIEYINEKIPSQKN